MIRPVIDHAILSPSGRVSKRARAVALAREGARLFPAGYFDVPKPTEAEVQQARCLTLRQSAKTLRELAARGMSRRKFTKVADALEAEAAALENP